MAPTAVVSGASGHLGANLVPLLLERGWRVRCLVHHSSDAFRELPVEAVPGDVLDPDGLRRVCAGADVCFHLAGVVSITGGRGGLVERVNIEGTANVAAVCREMGLRLVHCASIQAFDWRVGTGSLDESYPPALDDEAPAYDRSKAHGVRVVRAEVERGLDAVVCYPTSVIGPRDYGPSRTGRLLTALARRKLPCLVDGAFDWVDARDTALGLLAAAERGRRGGDYLLGGHYLELTELATRWCSLIGVPAPSLKAPRVLARLGAPLVEFYHRIVGSEPLFTGEALRALERGIAVDCTRARNELAYHPRPIEDTLRDTTAWFRSRGWLSVEYQQ